MIRRLAMVGFLGALVACQNTTDGSSAAKSLSDSELAAKVEGEVITKADFEVAVLRNMARYQGQGHKLPPGIEQRIRESVLRRLIDETVIGVKAKKIGVVITAEEIAKKYAEHKKRFRTDEAFKDYLKRSNNTEENMKRDLERNLLRDRVVEKMTGVLQIPDTDVKNYYDEHIRRFQEKEQVKASRILFRVLSKASEGERNAAKKKAHRIWQLALQEGADFPSLAAEHSNGPEAGRGGELNWISRGRMPPAFDNAAFSLEAGKVSGVVQTKLGYEIIKVWEKKAERQRPFDEVSTNIKNSLMARQRNEKRREVLRELKGGANVEQLIKFERQGPQTSGKTKVASPGKINVKDQLKLKQPPVVAKEGDNN